MITWLLFNPKGTIVWRVSTDTPLKSLMANLNVNLSQWAAMRADGWRYIREQTYQLEQRRQASKPVVLLCSPEEAW